MPTVGHACWYGNTLCLWNQRNAECNELEKAGLLSMLTGCIAGLHTQTREPPYNGTAVWNQSCHA